MFAVMGALRTRLELAFVACSVTPPEAVTPFTVPPAPVRLDTVRGVVAPLMSEIEPVVFAAMLLKMLLVFVSKALLASRIINPRVPRLIGALAVCEMVLAVSNVNTLLAKVEAGVQVVPEAPIVIAPAVLLPKSTLEANTRFRVALGRLKLPAPPAIPIVVPALPG